MTLLSLLAAPLLMTGPARAGEPPPPPKLNGEIGARAEYIANENFAETDAIKEDDTRFRLRVRARLGVEQRLGVFTGGLRLSTGDNTYPSSGWASLNDDFRRDLVQLDRAYINIDPSESFQLRLGAEQNPLFTPTEMMWDGDVQPAGVAEVVRLGKTGLALTAGQFMLKEIRSSKEENEESSFLFAQGISWAPKLGGGSLTVGASYYHYTDADAIGRAIAAGELDSDYMTNRFDPPAADGTASTGLYSDFRVVQAGLKAELAPVPLSIAGEFAMNLGAEGDASLGAAYEEPANVAAGGMIRYGKNKADWDWMVGAGFFHVEADAVLAVYTSDDLQQTNVNSVPVELALRLPGGPRLVWDTYVQQKVDTDLASNGGGVHDESAPKVRSRMSLLLPF